MCGVDGSQMLKAIEEPVIGRLLEFLKRRVFLYQLLYIYALSAKELYGTNVIYLSEYVFLKTRLLKYKEHH